MTNASSRKMLEKALNGDDIVVGTRYAGAGQVGEGLSKTREAGSRFATQLSGLVTGKALSDPMSGFFLMRREVFDEVAGSLSNEGFKILLDIVVSVSRERARAGQGRSRSAKCPTPSASATPARAR